MTTIEPPPRTPQPRGVCQVPRCPEPEPARLYPGGWYCDQHRPQPRPRPPSRPPG